MSPKNIWKVVRDTSNATGSGTYSHDRGNIIERDEPYILALAEIDACREWLVPLRLQTGRWQAVEYL